ncbi:19289_t:CDS:2 [Rhizophagus irregularis]|nr:19289_t:CDS:2 [Rhizophagus irregularis]
MISCSNFNLLILVILVLILSKICISRQNQVEDRIEVLKELMRQRPLPINTINPRKKLHLYNFYCTVFYSHSEYLNVPNDPKLKVLVSKLFSEESKETKEYYQSIYKYLVESNKNNKSTYNHNNIKSKENDKSIRDYIIVEMESKENNKLAREYTIKSKENNGLIRDYTLKSKENNKLAREYIIEMESKENNKLAREYTIKSKKNNGLIRDYTLKSKENNKLAREYIIEMESKENTTFTVLAVGYSFCEITYYGKVV